MRNIYAEITYKDRRKEQLKDTTGWAMVATAILLVILIG